MNETTKTATFVVVAACLLGMAAFANRPVGGTPGAFLDQGEPFYPDFNVPEQARSLRVVEYDEATGRSEPFQVEMKDGRWIIPSHYDYPADAEDRLSKTAGGILGLEKATLRSDRPEDFKAMGVVDPLDPKLTSFEGVGTRVTLEDEAGGLLADLIVGKPVPNASGQRFVRVPGHNAVYGVPMTGVELSTRFNDWIETNLLGFQATDIREVTIDKHAVDLARGTIEGGDFLTLERPDASTPWSLEEAAPGGREVDPSKVTTLTATLADLKIVGVRPKPAGLTADLKSESEEGLRLSDLAIRSLKTRGFYLTQGRLISNDGDLIVTTADGVRTTLQFGAVTFARGESLSAGTESEASSSVDSPKSESPEPAPPAGAIESRYLFVTAAFDPSRFQAPTPPEPPKPPGPGELPADPFARTASGRAEAEKARQAPYQSVLADYTRKIEGGRAKAKAMTDRFAGWYYVVPGDAYRKLMLDRMALTRVPPPTPPPGMPPAGFPDGFPGGGAGGFPGLRPPPGH